MSIFGSREPILSRKRKAPKRYDDGSAQPEFFDDLVITGINERFDQPGYKMYENLENLLLKAVKQEKFETASRCACQQFSS